MELIESFINNVAVIVAGIYLFHRFQYQEEKTFIFSKNYITLFMTLIGILLLWNPVQYADVTISLAFVPLLFLGRYTNFVYSLGSAAILALAAYFFFGESLLNSCVLLIIGAVVGMIGPFIKQSHFISLLWLNASALLIYGIFQFFLPAYDLRHFLVLTLFSFIMTICAALMFIDIWRISKLIKRYQNEDSIDYVTGLGNFKEFDRVLNRTSKKTDQSMALILIDIDGFKDVNDAFGHKAGDAVLRQMAQVITNYVPDDIQTFRNAGEEFSAILLGTTLDESIKLAESIRTGVKNSTFHLPNSDTLNLTVSIGVGYMLAGDTKSHRKIFKDADDMLHAAKAQGRDSVMFNPIIK